MELMIPPPTPTPDPNFAGAAADFKRGGWIVSLLGGVGMLVRLLLDDEEHKVIYWVRRFIAGSIVGVLAYFSLWGTDIDGLKKSVIMVTAGVFTPDIMERLRKAFKGTNEKAKNSSSYRKKNRK